MCVSVATLLMRLAAGTYVASEDVKNAGAKKEASVTVTRSAGKGLPGVPYEVIDNPARLTDKDWCVPLLPAVSAHSCAGIGWWPCSR